MRRLLILACSATKSPAAGTMPARERYQGPLWQTLRAVDPDGRLATTCALSARYGLLHDAQPIPDYDALMTQQRAEQLASNPLCRTWHAEDRPRAYGEHGDRWPALAVLNRLSAPGPWHEVCVVGGHLYLPVAQAIVRELRCFGLLDVTAPAVVINGEIGRMRQQLRAWLLQPITREAA